MELMELPFPVPEEVKGRKPSIRAVRQSPQQELDGFPARHVGSAAADEPVGFAFYELDEALLYFGRLSVLPEWRRRGIGGALLDYVERVARESGTAGVRLGVRLQLPHLIARYERQGYRTTKQMTHTGYVHPTFIYMEKRF